MKRPRLGNIVGTLWVAACVSESEIFKAATFDCLSHAAQQLSWSLFFLSTCLSATTDLSSLTKKAISISVKLHSPCDSDAVKPQSGNFQNCVFSNCTEAGQAPVCNEAFFFSVLPSLPCELERSCLPAQFSWGESLYLCWIVLTIHYQSIISILRLLLSDEISQLR